MGEDIFPDELRHHGKDLVQTGHFRHELYEVCRKNLDLVLEILETGRHHREAKDRMRVEKPTKGGLWELVYAETPDEIILIHIKRLRR